MDSRSWWTPEPDPPEWALPDDLRARDVLGARDIGWINQMRPFVRHFTAPGEGVFDPFCGFGSTLLAAAVEGRVGSGMEIDPARAALARERLRRHGMDGAIAVGSLPEQAPPQPFALCLSNVPYFGCRWPDASDGAQLYVQAHYAGYLQRLRAIFHAVREALPDRGHCIVMAENLRLDGRLLPLAWDVGTLLGSLFTACEERVLCYDRPGTPLPPGDSRSNRSHEYALVFRKERAPVCLHQTQAVLDGLAAAGFVWRLHGSFAAWQDGTATAPPHDADLWLPDDPQHWQRLLQWLQAAGFALSLWGRPVSASVALAELREHHYLRAIRIGRDGGRVQLDLALDPAAVSAAPGETVTIETIAPSGARSLELP